MANIISKQPNLRLKCLIVDDEENAIDGVVDYLGEIDSLEVLGTCLSAIEAIEVLKKQDIDLMFLDIRIKVIVRFRHLNWHLLLENKENEGANPKSPSVSVVMVVTEEDVNITNALKSIKEQTWDNWELILVDSREGRSLMHYKDSRIRRIEVDKDLSKYTLLNIGCGIAKGKYICFMDPHFISRPDRLHAQYLFMEDKEKVVAAAETLDGENLLWSSMIIRRNVLHQIKYYNELLEDRAEQELLYRLLKKGDIILQENIFLFQDV